MKQMASASSSGITDCSLPNWYAKFESVTIKTIFIPITQDFIDYLLSDGITLPEGCELASHDVCKGNDKEDEEDWADEGNNCTQNRVSFPELVSQISKSICILNGQVFPKINSSSPKDAVWINWNNTMKCTLPGEVILLLKSSDIIASTVSCHKPSTQSHQLCLREWIDIQPSGEFRCFIKDRQLIGVCQRYLNNVYKHLINSVKEVMADISDFYKRCINDQFPLDNFVMDVYRPVKGRVMLIDFNPFTHFTDPLLFTWNELESLNNSSLELRLVDPHSVMQSSDGYQLPKDVIDLSTGQDVHKLIDLLKMQTNLQSDED